MANVAGEIAEVKSLVKEVILKVDHFTSLQNEVQALKDAIVDLKKSAVRDRIIFPVIAIICGSILTILITSFVAHGGK
jgi:hypothetical protein